jgi:hypothetical protein
MRQPDWVPEHYNSSRNSIQTSPQAERRPVPQQHEEPRQQRIMTAQIKYKVPSTLTFYSTYNRALAFQNVLPGQRGSLCECPARQLQLFTYLFIYLFYFSPRQGEPPCGCPARQLQLFIYLFIYFIFPPGKGSPRVAVPRGSSSSLYR